ncbi:class I SAM-dependent methyltransferase [Mesorhizobium sp. B2-4-12]|uniref:class I SAM-dependent methyltransferase n=1 Tax=unclassified Mesorhizobium TaxID=325217 RepID=UPI00112AE04A|nr:MULTISPECIES: class I SAM-dependent methyltransferase [unclassified Mesorhizobium]TPK98728.1 class I SAM-dependent methyltransferase [Mesorhizobium sp. B2-4-12]TPL12393.1 class I SAM-dependent methyltransferase [Mesorhizobium sp. B2-4-14]
MTAPRPGSVHEAAAAMRTLEICMIDGVSPEVALARLAVHVDTGIDAADLADIALTMRSNDSAERYWLKSVAALLLRKLDDFEDLRAAAAAVCHDIDESEMAAATVQRLASGFDGAAAISPAASVQLSSLGDEEILAATTAEIVGWLEGHGFTGSGKDILDIGCGIGRFERALHAMVGRLVGIDISSTMLAIAGGQCSFANVELRQTSGLDLTDFADKSFDGILAIDSFPYLVLAGLAQRHLSEMARVLRPGGMAAVLNYSYRGAVALDRYDIHRFANASGMRIIVDAEMPFSRWDGTAFLLRAGGT